MDTHHLHVDEISIWSWIAASVFALIAVCALLLGAQSQTGLSSVHAPSLPLTEPALLPQAIADPRL
jgi:hypothetical protein